MKTSDIHWRKNPGVTLKDHPDGTSLLLKWKVGRSFRTDICELFTDTKGVKRFISTSLLRFVSPQNASFTLITYPHTKVRVEPVESEPMVYLVESESAPVPEGHDWREHAHRVELVSEEIEVGGQVILNGHCTCESMNYDKHKRIANEHVSRCKHIRRCIPLAYERLVVWWAGHNKELKATR